MYDRFSVQNKPSHLPFLALNKPTHLHHPCVKWSTETMGNFDWLCSLFQSLLKEYTYRYGKIHACQSKVDCFKYIRRFICGRSEMTPFVLAMPDDCKCSDAVQSYRNYYIKYKRHLAHWKRDQPDWWQ
jgi:hypothetical protein